MAKSGVYTDEKFRILLDALKKLEQSGQVFTIQELAVASGYKDSSLRTYVSKKLKNYVLYSTSKGKYTCAGAVKLDLGEFLKHMSQRTAPIDKEAQGLPPRLIRRSLDAFYLALELYNRPTQANRIEAFCIMMINAWELFLKAELSSSQGEQALFYTDEPERSLSLRDVLKRLIPDQKDDVRVNIEYLAELRDKAIHLLIPELQPQLSRLFQASVFNYLERYKNITGINPAQNLGTGLISLVIDGEELSTVTLKEAYDKRTAMEIGEFLERFLDTERELASRKFAIPIDYKLVLTKKTSEGDLYLSSSANGPAAYLIEVPKDVDKTHPYRQGAAIRKINELLSSSNTMILTSHDFQAIVYREKIRATTSSPHYYLLTNPETHRYSELFLTFVVEKVRSDADYLYRCRESYRHYQKQKPTKKSS